MTEEERYKIISEDYFDLIIEYNDNMKVFDRYPNTTYHIMNDKYAILYVPVDEFNGSSIRQYGYNAIPSCYGLSVPSGFEASGITRLRSIPNFDLRGEGVLIGIIDTGIEYTNPVFRNQNGTSRIAAIWDQTIDSDRYPLPYYYGTQYLMDEINEALRSENPLEIVPSTDENGHGTMLAGIAAGSEVPESNFSGVASASELVVVKLKQAKAALRDFFIIPAEADCYQENDIMWAFQYVIEIARNLKRPIAICIGLSSSQGSHDGRGALSNVMAVGSDFPGVVTAVAAGNEGNAEKHFYSEIKREIGYSTVELNIAENEPGFSMEIWGAAPDTYSIDILSPTGEYIPRIPEGLSVSREVSFIFERTRISIDYQLVEATTGDQLILMRFRNPTAGIWNIKVYGRGDLLGSFHIWLPISSFVAEDTYFVQSDPYTTITSPGNSPIPITVTAYNPENNTLYRRASKGYTRINVIKPEIAAPGVNMLAPDLQNGFTNMTGTSAAAAHTAGVTAMILEWAVVRGNYPGADSVDIKKFLIRGAQRNPRISYPNRDWGYGILDIYNVYNTLRVNI